MLTVGVFHLSRFVEGGQNIRGLVRSLCRRIHETPMSLRNPASWTTRLQVGSSNAHHVRAGKARAYSSAISDA